MLQKIRDKAQGIFSWVILVVICVPFALWGIQNYVDVGKETPIAKVGEKEFFQRDVNRAYEQFSQQYAGKGIGEDILKQQALNKLISDEVLLQYVTDEGLTVTDDMVRSYISGLQYFQVDGKFSKKQYQTLLASQNMSSAEFAGRIRNALIMGQFQNTIINSSFTTPYEIDSFFKIQNQQRSVEYVTVNLAEITAQADAAEIEAYYQAHLNDYQSPEQVSIAYIDLSLDALANDVDVSEEQLLAFYEDQKDTYTAKERRKISHILFKFNKDADQDDVVLKKAKQAQQRLLTEDFAVVANELSEDKLTAKNGGDLGLFNVGDMEAALESAIVALKQGEVSEPVKSAFGYHLLKVTELSPERVKNFAEVKDEITISYKRTEAENTFFELGETLTEVSYENPDNLEAVADAIGIEIKTTAVFSKGQGVDIATDPSVEVAAFSEEVLKGNNSDPIEIGTDRLVVVRMLDYQPAAAQALEQVQGHVIKALQKQQAERQTLAEAEQIKLQIQQGQVLADVAQSKGLEIKTYPALTRNNGEVSFQLNQAIFKAAKPVGDVPTLEIVALPTGEQVVISLSAVKPGVMTEQEKQQMDLAESNIARVMGQSTFAAFLKELEANSGVSIAN